jgi:hypothetical protein
VVLKPGFGGKSSATSVDCDPTFGAIHKKCGVKSATFSTGVFKKVLKKKNPGSAIKMCYTWCYPFAALFFSTFAALF